MTLPDADVSFFWAAMAQLEPVLRPIFAERVTKSLGAHPDPGPGDVDRAIRVSLDGLWSPPTVADPSRWDRDTPRFERISKRAV